MRIGVGPAPGLGGVIVLALTVTGSLIGRIAEDRGLRVEPIREQPVSPAVGGKSPAGFAYVGNLTCNARGCHGGVEPIGHQGSEYTNWLRTDRHAIAFDVLRDERSLGIVANLRRVDRETARPEADALCLSCHGFPKDSSSQTLAVGGVGCEACHGPAGNWLNEHYSPGWKSKSAEAKAASGMIDLSSTASQARTCMPCHVGSLGGNDGKEVHHDLIAAGHPRLRFEFSAFMEQMPRHWSSELPTDPAPRRWLVGQIAQAEAAVRLVGDRAARAHPWPEFAEFDCFACHHDLRNERFRLGKDPGGGRLGQPGWRTWDFAMLMPLAAAQDVQSHQSLEQLMNVMHDGLAADPATAKELAAGADKSLKRWLDEFASRSEGANSAESTEILRRLLAGLTPEDGRRLAANWDSATQLFRAAAALADVQPTPERERALGELLTLLSYPEDRDSPVLKYPGTAVPEAIDRLLESYRSPTADRP